MHSLHRALSTDSRRIGENAVLDTGVRSSIIRRVVVPVIVAGARVRWRIDTLLRDLLDLVLLLLLLNHLLIIAGLPIELGLTSNIDLLLLLLLIWVRVVLSVVRCRIHLLSGLLLRAMLLLLLLAPTTHSNHVGVATEGALAQCSRSLLLHLLLLMVEIGIAHLHVDHLTHGCVVHVGIALWPGDARGRIPWRHIVVEIGDGGALPHLLLVLLVWLLEVRLMLTAGAHGCRRLLVLRRIALLLLMLVLSCHHLMILLLAVDQVLLSELLLLSALHIHIERLLTLVLVVLQELLVWVGSRG